jgi:hypothetical protein
MRVSSTRIQDWMRSARVAVLRDGVRRKEGGFAVLFGTTSQPLIRSAHPGQNALVMPCYVWNVEPGIAVRVKRRKCSFPSFAKSAKDGTHNLSMFIHSIHLPGATLYSVNTSAANFRSAVAAHIGQSN